MSGDLPKLLPCPFCGAEAEVVHFDGSGCAVDDENFGGSCVQCSKCQASSAVVFGFKETLYSRWNERARRPSGAFTTKALRIGFGNGVPLSMGRAVARAVKRALHHSEQAIVEAEGPTP